MERFFSVAEHNFCLRSHLEDLPWQRLISNYDPFEIDKTDDLIFTVELSENVSCDGAVQIFTSNGDDDYSLIKLFRRGEEWIAEFWSGSDDKLFLRMSLSKDFSYSRLQIFEKKAFRYSINSALMLSYTLRTSREKTLLMHSSVTVKDGKGYMFLGESGTGKSTHSSLWLKYIGDCFLLNDDNPVIRIVNGKFYVYGTPWSGKTPCYKQDKAEIGALVSLIQHSENKIERQSNLEAYKSLYTSSSGFKKDRLLSDYLFETTKDVVLNVPFYTLWCLPDQGAAELCYKTVSR